MSSSRKRTQVEIDLGAVKRNIQELRRYVQANVGLMVVVKANAYGHGLVEVATQVCESGAQSLAVSDVEESVILREAGITCPILVLGSTAASDAPTVVHYNLTQAICTEDLVEKLSYEALASGKTAKVHVNIDTGIERLGVPSPRALSFVKHVLSQPGIVVEGIFTHFAEADRPRSRFTEYQLEVFRGVLNSLEVAGIRIPVKHAANSAAVLHFPSSHFDLVRPGIAVYGVYPSSESSDMIHLEPVMSLRTEIIRLRRVQKGSGLSYERQFTTKKDSTIATLPIGYADGYPCSLSNAAEVLVHGIRAPVVGAICMDMTLVDVSHVPDVRIGDDVVLLGSQGSATISVQELARRAGTIGYEIVCGIRSRVPRRFLHS